MACTGAVCCESDFDVTGAELDRCDQLAQHRPFRMRRLPVIARSVACSCTHVVAAARQALPRLAKRSVRDLLRA